MHRSLILAVALSALAAGPALAQEGGLDAVEMSITIDPVTDVSDVGTSTDITVDDRDRLDDASGAHILLPLHDEGSDRDHEAAGDGDREHDLDHERDMDRGTDLDVDHDHGEVGGDVGGDVDVPDMPDAPDTPDTGDTGEIGDVESGD
jgi:hypothetical protein